MSLAIDVDKISAILLADGWHGVGFNSDGTSSFCCDAYEFVWYGPNSDPDNRSPAQIDQPPGMSTGFSFFSELRKATVSGPLQAILAVETEK